MLAPGRGGQLVTLRRLARHSNVACRRTVGALGPVDLSAADHLAQPLRWFMGRWARRMNQTLAGMLPPQGGRIMHWHPETTTAVGMAVDGIHPSSAGYAAWAEGLSPRILARVAQMPTA